MFVAIFLSGHEAAGAEGAHDGLVPPATPHAPLHPKPRVLHDGRGLWKETWRMSFVGGQRKRLLYRALCLL